MWPKYILWYGNLFYIHIPSFPFYSTYIVSITLKLCQIAKLSPSQPTNPEHGAEKALLSVELELS